ncbi:9409_t:CDS:1, partial [Ambispora gerdemannii]
MRFPVYPASITPPWTTILLAAIEERDANCIIVPSGTSTAILRSIFVTVWGSSSKGFFPGYQRSNPAS